MTQQQLFELYDLCRNDNLNHDEFFKPWNLWESNYRDHEFQKSVYLDAALIELNGCKSLFYPGAGYDFSTLKFFMEMSAVKNYYYCDYMNDEITNISVFENLVNQLSPFGFLVQNIGNLRQEYFNQNQWAAYWYPSQEARFGGTVFQSFISLYRIIKGGRQFNLYYFGTEAIQTYEILLKNKINFDIVVTQDHGLGGLWTTFCNGSILETLSRQYKKMPKILMVGQGQDSWDGYENITQPFGSFGLHQSSRLFYGLI